MLHSAGLQPLRAVHMAGLYLSSCSPLPLQFHMWLHYLLQNKKLIHACTVSISALEPQLLENALPVVIDVQSQCVHPPPFVHPSARPSARLTSPAPHLSSLAQGRPVYLRYRPLQSCNPYDPRYGKRLLRATSFCSPNCVTNEHRVLRSA